MLSQHDKQQVITILDEVLGVGTSLKNDEHFTIVLSVITTRKSYKLT